MSVLLLGVFPGLVHSGLGAGLFGFGFLGRHLALSLGLVLLCLAFAFQRLVAGELAGGLFHFALELGGIVDHLVDKLYDDQLAARRQEDGWQDYLVRLAHGVREIAIGHPHLFPTLATRPPEAPWVRPPLRSMKWMETFLDTLISYGFDDRAAVSAYRAYTTFLLGQLLLEVSARGASLSSVEDELPEKTLRSLSSYPNLQRMQKQLSEDHSATEFEEALESLLDRLENGAPR